MLSAYQLYSLRLNIFVAIQNIREQSLYQVMLTLKHEILNLFIDNADRDKVRLTHEESQGIARVFVET